MSERTKIGTSPRNSAEEMERSESQNTLGQVPEQDGGSKGESSGTNLNKGIRLDDLSQGDLCQLLGEAHYDQFQLFGKLNEIEEAIKYGTLALVFTPDGHPRLSHRLARLGSLYSNRFQRLGELDDLEKSLEYKFRALELTPDGHPDLPFLLVNLGVSYTDRFRRLGELDDLGESIKYKSRALELTPDGDPSLPLRLASLAVSYVGRYFHLGGLGDLERTIECESRALKLTLNDHPDLPDRFSNLAVSYNTRFRRLDQLDDLEKSIECMSRALELTPKGHPDLPGRFAGLAAFYSDRYRRLGELDDLDKSLNYGSSALELTPDDHPQLSSWLSYMAAFYTDRFHFSDRLAGQAVSYTDRFQRLCALDDLDKALEYKYRALDLTPDGHPDLSNRLISLAKTHYNRFQHLGELDDLEKSIEYRSRALKLTPDGHPDLPGQIFGLGASYRERFEHLGEPDDLAKAIQYQSHGLTRTPENHPSLPLCHFSWALSCLSQYEHTGDSSNLNCSLDSFRKASQSVVGAPRDRFGYAFTWAKLASEYESLNCIEAYHNTMDLLPEFIWLGATTNQRYRNLSLAEGLAVRAASAAILYSDHRLALEWLEHARCVVWNQSLMLRSPLDLLESSHPELATRLQTVANQLHQASSGSPVPQGSSALEDRLHLARDYNNLLAQAHKMSGFEDFLQPVKAIGLTRAACHGPVVVINCHEDHCDALLILPGSDNVQHLPLANFTEEMGRHARSEILKSLRRKGLRERGVRIRQEPGPNDSIGRVLATLWNGIVKPILDFLGYTNFVSADSLPHITWCLTGVISFLPLHAAGDYDQPRSRVFDYAISSYTPNLTALLASTPNSLSAGSRVLAIGQEATPSHKPLPGTTRELAYVKAHTENIAKYSQLADCQATTTAVLDAMEQHDWVHLACHAHQNIDDPTKSGFFLHDGTLDLAAINRRSFKNKGLAFLSACQTATGDEKLPDEAIHLASGMLMAGYPSVIATMWSVVDDDAPFVADKVYDQLMKEGKVGNGEGGRALHNAVAELRGKVGEKEFARWVPYIHIGS
ncbi:hypothetical protein OPQ81_003416 [Rhizoctonia solani]|nr:hypothetical protein OPQ81_003416 [Rhizoctonia solani]